MRPPKPEFLAVQSSPRWRVITDPEEGMRLRCRHHPCRAPSVMQHRQIDDGKYMRWMAYCAAHALGRWIENGEVWEWQKVQN